MQHETEIFKAALFFEWILQGSLMDRKGAGK
jgi:hypothetical protein